MNIISTFNNFIIGVRDSRASYYKTARNDIANSNIRTLKNISTITFFLFIFFIFITPYIMPDWKISAAYIVPLPMLFIVALFSWFYYKKPSRNYWVVCVACTAFLILLLCSLITIDVFGTPDSSASFLPVLFVITPILFTLPFSITLPMIIVAEMIFVILSTTYKNPIISENDVFNSLVGMVFSFISSSIISQMHIKDNNIKYLYKHLSSIDSLTHIFNKSTSATLIKEYLGYKSPSEKCAILIMDIDSFKEVNDNYGHHVGDVVLEKTGELLLECFRSSDIVGRMGGDEFIVFLKNINSESFIESKCEFLHKMISKLSYLTPGFELTFSIGGSILDTPEATYKDAFLTADEALYEVKNNGKSSHIINTVKVRKYINENSNNNLLLIADDDEINRKILASAFSDEYDIIEASNGIEAMTVINTYAKDLSAVLLDIYMPKADGFKVMKHMKSNEEYRNIPIIVVTADGISEREALRNGASDTIIKPVNIEVAKLRLNNVLKK